MIIVFLESALYGSFQTEMQKTCIYDGQRVADNPIPVCPVLLRLYHHSASSLKWFSAYRRIICCAFSYGRKRLYRPKPRLPQALGRTTARYCCCRRSEGTVHLYRYYRYLCRCPDSALRQAAFQSPPFPHSRRPYRCAPFHAFPIFCAPGIRPSAQYWLILRSDTPHFSAASRRERYCFMLPPPLCLGLFSACCHRLLYTKYRRFSSSLYRIRDKVRKLSVLTPMEYHEKNYR